MSKFNSNFVKSKIESIAKKPENILSSDESKNNQLNISTKTLKDSFSYIEEFRESFHNKEQPIKKVETYYMKNNLKLDVYQNQNSSSIRTKGSSGNINGTCDYSIIQENNEKIENKKIIFDNMIKEINIDELNELKEIYNDLFILFSDIKLEENSNKSKNEEIIKKLKILAFHYLTILLNENIKKVIIIFNDSIEVNKFFLYQIYLILSVIYLVQEKLNEYLFLSYKTILLYSLQNFEIITQILNDYSLLGENKTTKNIFIMNKIILSLLKTLTNIPPNSQILKYISPINNKDKNESGINNLINLLKNNKDLKEKMSQIEKEENKIIQNIKASEQKILPEFDSKKYLFSIFIELDETLVHYCEEGENYFVKVRLGSEKFLDFIKKFCEIIIISTSSKEYSDIIIDNLNKKGDVIKYRIYTEENSILNLSKINRELNKCIFISHEENFMKQPKENSIILKGFYGDEGDKEFIKLEKEFKKIENLEKNKDIRDVIKDIQNNINKEK